MPIPAMLPNWLNSSSSRSICDWNRTPAPRPTPTQSTAEQALKETKRGQPTRRAPAIGGAMMARPGMNFAMTRELMPQRSKRVCVWLTQESGSREILHRALRTRMPYLSPIQYQPQSAVRHAITAPRNSAGKDECRHRGHGNTDLVE